MKNIERFAELFQNEASFEELKSMKSVDALVAFLAENDVEATAEELHNIYLRISSNDCELSEDVLQEVSGGAKWTLDRFLREWSDAYVGVWMGILGL